MLYSEYICNAMYLFFLLRQINSDLFSLIFLVSLSLILALFLFVEGGGGGGRGRGCLSVCLCLSLSLSVSPLPPAHLSLSLSLALSLVLCLVLTPPLPLTHSTFPCCTLRMTHHSSLLKPHSSCTLQSFDLLRVVTVIVLFETCLGNGCPQCYDICLSHCWDII